MNRKKRVRTREATAKLLEVPGAVLRDDYAALLEAKVYELADKRVLIVRPDGKGALWDPEDFVEVLAAVSKPATGQGRHILDGRITNSEAFLESVPDAADELSKTLGLPIEDLTYTIDSLIAIDRRIFRHLEPQTCLEPRLFLPLTAYLGEVLRREVGGEWVLRRDASGLISEPWVVNHEGQEFAPWSIVYEEANEFRHQRSFRNAVQIALDLSHPTDSR